MGPEPFRLFRSLDLVDLFGAQLADGRHFTIADLPETKRTGNITVRVEADWTDDPLILHRFAILDELQGLGKFFLSRMDRRTAIGHHFRHRTLDGGGIRFARR